MSQNQNAAMRGKSNGYKTVLIFRSLMIHTRKKKRVIENRFTFLKAYFMLLDIGFGLHLIPFKYEFHMLIRPG